MGIGGWGNLAWITFDRPGARGAAQWRTVSVVADQEKGLSGIVRVRTWLAHELSSYFDTALPGLRRVVDV
jgi:hypothetical protein